jgi:hypothetical protein
MKVFLRKKQLISSGEILFGDEIRRGSKIKDGEVPVLPSIPALMAILMYYLLWS